jgi:circadian clock protein KaiC
MLRMFERVPTGIAGFDKLTESSMIRSTRMVFAGFAGSGKAVFAMQFHNEGLTCGEVVS